MSRINLLAYLTQTLELPETVIHSLAETTPLKWFSDLINLFIENGWKITYEDNQTIMWEKGLRVIRVDMDNPFTQTAPYRPHVWAEKERTTGALAWFRILNESFSVHNIGKINVFTSKDNGYNRIVINNLITHIIK